MAVEYVKDSKLAIITISRPEVHNALNIEAIQELHSAVMEFLDDPEVLVGIITGVGEKAFCAGADIEDMLPFLKEHRGKPEAFLAPPMRGVKIEKPLIAAINGLAIGGGLELALACDLRVASDNARFGLTEVSLGLIPGWGGTQRLPRVIPFAKATELIMMGGIIDADEAGRIGLVNKVVTQGELMPTAREWARIISQKAPLAVRAAKQAMIEGINKSLEEGLKLEFSLLGDVLGTEDFIEGTEAFMGKRKPAFKGR
ncbi:enoyl-CoA hydratase/isomerase family protein [Chloroflexota bacterium]